MVTYEDSYMSRDNQLMSLQIFAFNNRNSISMVYTEIYSGPFEGDSEFIKKCLHNKLQYFIKKLYKDFLKYCKGWLVKNILDTIYYSQ